MIPLEDTFSEITSKETILLQIDEDKQLPSGNYAFIEYYCPNNDCDCQGGTFEVVRYGDYPGHEEKTIAWINFSWKNKGYL